MNTTTRTPEELARRVRVAQRAYRIAQKELQEARAEERAVLLKDNPFKVGDMVHTWKGSTWPVPVIQVNPRSVVVKNGCFEDRVPLHRVRLAEEEQSA